MNKIIKLALTGLLLFAPLFTWAQTETQIPIKKEVFELLDLENPNLDKVKEAYQQKNYEDAAQELLSYYRARKRTLDLKKITLRAADQKMADDALKHIFFVHTSYEPLFYGDDINWDYWPIQDNELRWQLHRHKWFTPMGRVYQVSGDEKYAKEWVFQFMDWIKKNPLGVFPDDGIPDDNVNFSWRTLEVSVRLSDQNNQFQLYIDSENFTPAFLTQFLVNYYRQVEHIMGHFSAAGNHVLFESQRVLTSGAFFPEFKKAEHWRKTGVDKLNAQIKEQVYDDGFQYELCPHYHVESARLFMGGLTTAKQNGYAKEIPQSYSRAIEKMVEAYCNILFWDYTPPMFSDTRLATRQSTMNNFKAWRKLFPENKMIEYFETEGKSGALPDYTSRAFLNSGFFTFRSGWQKEDIAMVVKAGPPAFWHNQPDNGTFDLMVKGRNFFPDSGCFVYAGDEEIMKWRNFFRSTAAHKTLTLNNQDLDTTDSKTLLWETEGNIETLVTENQSYDSLAHRRSIYFVDKEFFVIVDEAKGNAEGEVGLHFQFDANPVDVDQNLGTIATTYDDGNNIVMKTTANQEYKIVTEEGWMSREYLNKVERPAYSFSIDKKDNTPIRYITVILPVANKDAAPKIKAKINKVSTDNKKMDLTVTIGKKKHNLGYSLK